MLGLKMAVDFGTTGTMIYIDGRGIVLSEPSVMICDRYSGRTLASGIEAEEMAEKIPPSMSVVRPISEGIICDREKAVAMLTRYFNRFCRGRIFRPNVLMCVPGSMSPLEKKTVTDVVISSGAGRACFIDVALASAFGAGLSPSQKEGFCVCDIGGATTDCAVISGGRTVVSGTVKIGGNNFSEQIKSFVFREYNIVIPDTETEQIKRVLCSAVPRKDTVALTVCGKSSVTSLPVSVELESDRLFYVTEGLCREISSCVKSVLGITPPELSADIAKNGITLTGGMSQLFGMCEFLKKETGVAVHGAESPAECATLGMGKILGDIGFLYKNGYVFTGPADGDAYD